MKKNSHTCGLVFFLLFLIFSSQTSARLLANKQGEDALKVNINRENPLVEMEGSDSWNELMGLEDCENGDTECSKRRIIAEAHLDYIYTQHHKP